MPCKSCRSENQKTFDSEINVHFRGIDNLTKPTVWAFPKLIICLDCGFAECEIRESELHRLAEGLAVELR